MGPFEMVVAIVAIVMIASVVRSKYRARNLDEALGPDPDTARMREELKALKDRVAVLERIATDRSNTLEREIDALRSRD